MHAVQGTEHRHRVIAPQSTVTPNDFLRYAYDPAGDACIASVHKLPTLPVFVSCGRACLTWIVIGTMTELFFMTIVLLAGEKGAAAHILADVSFESPVLSVF